MGCTAAQPLRDRRGSFEPDRVNAADSGRPSLSVGLGVGLYGPFSSLVAELNFVEMEALN